MNRKIAPHRRYPLAFLTIMGATCSIALLIYFISYITASDDEKRIREIDKQYREIIYVIHKQDHDALKNMFSQKVIEEADDLDASIEELFVFFKGKVKRATRIGYGSISGSEKGINATYYLRTSVEPYYLAFRKCTENERYPDKVGLSSIYIITEAEKNKANTANTIYMYGEGDKPGIIIEDGEAFKNRQAH